MPETFNHARHSALGFGAADLRCDNYFTCVPLRAASERSDWVTKQRPRCSLSRPSWRRWSPSPPPASSDTREPLGEIVVTARKVEEESFGVPISLQVVSGDLVDAMTKSSSTSCSSTSRGWSLQTWA